MIVGVCCFVSRLWCGLVFSCVCLFVFWFWGLFLWSCSVVIFVVLGLVFGIPGCLVLGVVVCGFFGRFGGCWGFFFFFSFGLAVFWIPPLH